MLICHTEHTEHTEAEALAKFPEEARGNAAMSMGTSPKSSNLAEGCAESLSNCRALVSFVILIQ